MRTMPADALARQFRQDGYVILKGLLSTKQVQQLRADFSDALHQKVARFGLAPVVRPELLAGNDSVRNSFQPESGNHDLNRWNMHLPSRAPYLAVELLDSARLVRLLEQLLGADWVLYLLASDTPYPNAGYQAAHQDFSRFSIAVNVPLIDVDDRSAPIEVWPGSHRFGDDGALQAFSTIPKELPEATIRKVVANIPSRRLLLRAGDVLVRDHRMVHRGTAHLSDTPRYMLSLYAVPPQPASFRLVADAVALAALAMRRIGHGNGSVIRRRRLYGLGCVLGRLAEESSLSDRDWRRPIPRQLWAKLNSRTQHRLRYARIEGRRSVRGAGNLKGTRHLLKQLCYTLADAASRGSGEPRAPDFYSA